MIISVSKESLNVITGDSLTTGEYKAHEVIFKFIPEYANLLKIAVFKNGEKVYKVPVITENLIEKCFIPWEVLEEEGNLEIGVYGYFVTASEELQLRYSPKPIITYVSKGSYRENATNSEALTPTDKELIFQELNNIDLKTKNITGGVEIEMTNPKGEMTKSIVYNGKDGENGKDYVITEADYEAIADVVESEITLPTKTSDLTNDSGFITSTDVDTILQNKRINTSYSATETVVGTFLNKPLYRKVISLTKDEYNALSTGSNSRKLLDVSSLNVDNLVNAILCCNYSDVDGFHNKTSYMHRTDTNSYELGCHEIKANYLNFFIGNAILTALSGSANIILEYTKTTD